MISTSVSYAMCASAIAFRTRQGNSLVSSVRLLRGHHRHPCDPARNRLVEFLLHGVVTAARECGKGSDPGEDLVGAAAGRLAHLGRVERIGAPDLAAAQQRHEL